MHSVMAQVDALAVRVVTSAQMHSKSLDSHLVFLATASSMQGTAHLGMVEKSAAAEATATKVTKAAAEYFILTVVLGLVFGWGLKNEGDSRDSIVMQSERDGERKKKTRKRPDG